MSAAQRRPKPSKSVKQPTQKAAKKPAKNPTPKARRDLHTPLVRAALAVSLDGFIADADGGVAWLNPFFSPEIDFAGFMKSIGVAVMGGKTFDDALKLEGGESMMGGGKCIVVTHRPLANPLAGVETFAGDVRELAARLRLELAGTGKDIWLMGGGQAIDAFRAAGLVDRYELSIMPVLLGSGIPLFPTHARGLESVRQTHCRTLTNGIVEVWYESVRAPH